MFTFVILLKPKIKEKSNEKVSLCVAAVQKQLHNNNTKTKTNKYTNEKQQNSVLGR